MREVVLKEVLNELTTILLLLFGPGRIRPTTRSFYRMSPEGRPCLFVVVLSLNRLLTHSLSFSLSLTLFLFLTRFSFASTKTLELTCNVVLSRWFPFRISIFFRTMALIATREECLERHSSTEVARSEYYEYLVFFFYSFYEAHGRIAQIRTETISFEEKTPKKNS